MIKIKKYFTVLSVSVLIFVGVVLLEVSAKKTDDTRFTFDKYVPKMEFRNGVKETMNIVKERIKTIEQVPDSIQILIDSNDPITFIFFNGPMTDNPEMSHLKGQTPRGYNFGTWDKVYMAQSKGKIFLGVFGDYITDGTDFTMHEYGHVYDDKIGKIFYGKSLSETDLIVQYIDKNKDNIDRYFQNPREFVAQCFESYYTSTFSRNSLKSGKYDIYNLFKEIEDKSLEFDNKQKN